MTQRINGMSFDFSVDGSDFHAQKFSLDITDETKAVSKDGRPYGFVTGTVAASGTLNVDGDEFKKLKELASKAGAWQIIPPFDIVAYANTGDEEKKVEAFGCKVKLNKILDADKSSTDQSTYEIPFEVTSPDFVKIDGVPYVKPFTQK